MKGTEIFKKTIADYLQVRANADDLFAKSFAKEGKSIDKCVNYILNKVKESGCNGFTDDEIYGMAVHYYDEDDIKEEETKPINASSVVVNHEPTISEVALEAVAEESEKKTWPCYKSQSKKENKPQSKKESKKDNTQQLTLF